MNTSQLLSSRSRVNVLPKKKGVTQGNPPGYRHEASDKDTSKYQKQNKERKEKRKQKKKIVGCYALSVL